MYTGLPGDPVILLSVVTEKLKMIDYEYDAVRNQFV